jgi:hypothetical protein
MKRTGLALICLLAGTFLSFAGVVTPERSAGVAKNFFAATKAAGSSAMRLVASFPVSDTAAPDEAPAMYVYARESGGYVVVAGDDVAIPVLGYSTTGSFPTEAEMPVNMKSLLDWYAQVIGYARSQGWEPAASVRELWADPTKASASPMSTSVVLETANWNQWAPYNDLCPKPNGLSCPCGCVATAMAIIMRYHQWPVKGTGTLPAYDYWWDDAQQGYTQHVEPVLLGHTYEWDKMPLSYGNSYSQESGFQVAQLIRDLGVMSQMDYAPDGSGASGASPIKLAEYFGYDKQMRYQDREDYSDEHWEALIRHEIDAGRPVFHCGFSNGGGHAFVLDGYQDRYFHINYGWGGSSNNFYAMTPIEGQSDRLTEFNKWQDMVTHIMPDQGGAPYVSLSPYPYVSQLGWDFRAPSFQSPEMRFWVLTSTGSGPVEFCYCRYDREGNLKETLCEPFVREPQGYYLITPSVTCQAPSQVEDGDCIMLSCRGDLTEWEPIPQSRLNYLQFDRQRPLSELVSVGYTFGRVQDGTPYNLPNFFIRAYKDIYWEIRLDGEVVQRCSDREMQPEWKENLADFVDYEFIVQPGKGREYELFFRNFDEEMTLHIVL